MGMPHWVQTKGMTTLSMEDNRPPNGLALPTWAIVVMVAVIVAVAVATVLIVVFLKRRRQSQVRRVSDGTDATNFPVDVVCLWADGSDVAWRQSAATHFYQDSAANPDDKLVHSPMREPEPLAAGQRDELFYNVFSVAAFLPWVRRYVLVTARPHVPSWFPESLSQKYLGILDLHVVHHDELWPPEEHATKLPCFNSCAIQTRLPHIPGLAEHFILLDDDFFVGRPMERRHFFTDDGDPVARMFPLRPAAFSPGNWQRLCYNMQDMVVSAVGPGMVHIPDHVAYPCLRSAFAWVVQDVFADHAARMKRFRCRHDWVPAYVMLAILFRQGRVAPQSKDIVTLFIPAHSRKRLSANVQLPHLLCLNDRMTDQDRAVLDMMVASVSQSMALTLPL